MPRAVEDHYKILGVARTATPDEIRKAYRALAKKYHPDLHPGDRSSVDKFQKIGTAYAVLHDEAARAAYDHELSGFRTGPRVPYAPPPPRPTRATGTPPDFSSIRAHMHDVASEGGLESLRKQAQIDAKEILDKVPDFIHDGDTVQVSGGTYSFRRVQFKKVGDDKTVYRTRQLILCRNDVVLTLHGVKFLDGLRVAQRTDYSLFQYDVNRVGGEFVKLWQARKMANHLVSELTELMDKDQQLPSSSGGFRKLDLQFTNREGMFIETVLCRGAVIYDLISGEPVRAMKFAGRDDIKELANLYPELRKNAVDAARARGVDVPDRSMKSAANWTVARALKTLS